MFSALVYFGGRLPSSFAVTSIRWECSSHTARYFRYAASEPITSAETTTTETQAAITPPRERRGRVPLCGNWLPGSLRGPGGLTPASSWEPLTTPPGPEPHRLPPDLTRPGALGRVTFTVSSQSAMDDTTMVISARNAQRFRARYLASRVLAEVIRRVEHRRMLPDQGCYDSTRAAPGRGPGCTGSRLTRA